MFITRRKRKGKFSILELEYATKKLPHIFVGPSTQVS